FFFFSSRRRHTRFSRDWSSDVCSSDLQQQGRFLPSDISSINRSICCLLVSGCFTIVVQQIHSLRAMGVSAFHFSISCLPWDSMRSEERRVGKECRSRQAAGGQKKQSGA